MVADVVQRVSVIEARHDPATDPSSRSGRPSPPPAGQTTEQTTEQTPAWESAPGSYGRGSSRQTHLLQVLADLSERILAGEYAEPSEDGVIVDTVVGSIRCVLVIQQPSRLVSLSPREQQIAAMVARGRTNSSIAAALDISVWTVSTHLRRIFAKLAVGSRAEMVAHLRTSPGDLSSHTIR